MCESDISRPGQAQGRRESVTESSGDGVADNEEVVGPQATAAGSTMNPTVPTKDKDQDGHRQ